MYGNELGRAIARHRKIGVIVFRTPTEIAHCSSIAEQQLSEVGIRVNAGYLQASDDEVLSSLSQDVEICFAAQRSAESWVVVGDLTANALVIAVHFSDSTAAAQGVVVCLIRSVGVPDWEDDRKRIRQAFGLTAREAQLGLHLSQGKKLSEFAADNFLTINTVKIHLREIFKKMQVNRQTQVAVAVGPRCDEGWGGFGDASFLRNCLIF